MPKVYAQNGKRAVCKMVPADRGQLVTAVRWFKACGLWPLDDSILKKPGDDEFSAKTVTDEEPSLNVTAMPCNVSHAGGVIKQVTAVNEQARATANDHGIDADQIPETCRITMEKN